MLLATYDGYVTYVPYTSYIFISSYYNANKKKLTNDGLGTKIYLH